MRRVGFSQELHAPADLSVYGSRVEYVNVLATLAMRVLVAEDEHVPEGLTSGQPIEITAARLISLIELFAYTELRTAPTGPKRVPGTRDAQLLEDVKDRARELSFSDNELNGAAFSSWLEAPAAQPPS